MWRLPACDGLLFDPVDMREVAVVGDVLELFVEYGGGCETHDFSLCYADGFEGSDPLFVRARLSHDSHSDPCDAIVAELVDVSLEPLRDQFEAEYGPGGGSITIELGAYGPVLYSF